MGVARERNRLVPLKVMTTGRLTPLANAAIEIPPVMTVDVIKPVSVMPVMVTDRFIFWQSVHELQLNQEKMPRSQLIFAADVPAVLVVR